MVEPVTVWSNYADTIFGYTSSTPVTVSIPDDLWDSWPDSVDFPGFKEWFFQLTYEAFTSGPFLPTALVEVANLPDGPSFTFFAWLFPTTGGRPPRSTIGGGGNGLIRSQSLSFRITSQGGEGQGYGWTGVTLLLVPPVSGSGSGSGPLYTWGRNNAIGSNFDATGTSDTTDASLPYVWPLRTVNVPASVIDQSHSGWNGYALTTAGTVYAWGLNSGTRFLPSTLGTGSQLGTGAPDLIAHPTPVVVTGLPPISALESNAYVVYALDATIGNLWSWGQYTAGSFPEPAWNSESVIPILNLAGVSQVAVGTRHALALRSGRVWAQGYLFSDGVDQLWLWGFRRADGTITRTSDVLGANGNGKQVAWTETNLFDLSGMQAVKVWATFGNSYAQMEDGTIWGTGSIRFGALGSQPAAGTFTAGWSALSAADWVQVPLQPANIVDFSPQFVQTYYLDTAGTLWSAGSNASGALGRVEISTNFHTDQSSALGWSLLPIDEQPRPVTLPTGVVCVRPLPKLVARSNLERAIGASGIARAYTNAACIGLDLVAGTKAVYVWGDFYGGYGKLPSAPVSVPDITDVLTWSIGSTNLLVPTDLFVSIVTRRGRSFGSII